MNFLKRKALLKLPLVMLAALSLATGAYAQGNSANSNGKGPSANNGNGRQLVQNGRAAIKGNLKTSRHIYYSGDELDISVQFPRGYSLIADGEADAHVVIYFFDGSLMTVPVPSDIGPSPRRFFHMESVDISSLPEGQYQLGLVLTVPDGDPALLDDWYGGFRALLDTEAVYVSTQQLDTDDDGDGEHDDDTDGDGIDGEEEDEADED